MEPQTDPEELRSSEPEKEPSPSDSNSQNRAETSNPYFHLNHMTGSGGGSWAELEDAWMFERKRRGHRRQTLGENAEQRRKRESSINPA